MQKLNKIYSLKQEIISLEDEIYILGKYSVDTTKQRERLENKQNEIVKEIESVENILTTIQNSEHREILRQRLILNKSWSDIGNSMYIDRSTAYKIFRKYENELRNEK